MRLNKIVFIMTTMLGLVGASESWAFCTTIDDVFGTSSFSHKTRVQVVDFRSWPQVYVRTNPPDYGGHVKQSGYIHHRLLSDIPVPCLYSYGRGGPQ
jgi:hypothetical protein